jgi:hypothetical protein
MDGRFAAEDQWSAACALICYRASRTLGELSSEQYKILDELYERITKTRINEEEVHDLVIFCRKLHEFGKRERHRMLQSSEDQKVTPVQASQILEKFKYCELWYDLTKQQKQSKCWRSTLNTILHKRAGWKHAAQAIMQCALPILERAIQPDDATEHINALAQFAQDLSAWLQDFASSMHAYRIQNNYQKNYQTSLKALENRTRHIGEAD